MSTFDLTTLRAKTRNPRKISAADKAALAKSVADFSKMLALRPIVYDPVTMEVLGGNQRLVALKEAGYKEVPAAWVRSADDLTEEEKRRFVVSDNVQSGEWDTELLLADYAVEELKDWGVELPEFDVTSVDPKQAEERISIAIDPNADPIEAFEREMEKKDTKGAIPIVPMYAEKHEAFIILCDNTIDEAWLRNKLGLEKPLQSYKDTKARGANVVTVQQFKDRLKL